MDSATPFEHRPGDEVNRLAVRHARIGCWTLLVFLAMGLFLEALHGLKIRFYLDAANETRRLMWTLSHAHGTLVALIHLAFAALGRLVAPSGMRWLRFGSPLLTAAGLFLPLGFFLSGIFIYGSDPGLGILLVPLGGVLLLAAVFLMAVAFSSSRDRQPGEKRTEANLKRRPPRRSRN
jgi:hypothetical protein